MFIPKFSVLQNFFPMH